LEDAFEQGTSDKFLEQGQLLPENFLKAALAAGFDEAQVKVRRQEGYDHSYYFVRRIASNSHFIELVTLSRFPLLLRITYDVCSPSSDHSTLLTFTSPRWFP